MLRLAICHARIPPFYRTPFDVFKHAMNFCHQSQDILYGLTIFMISPIKKSIYLTSYQLNSNQFISTTEMNQKVCSRFEFN